MKHNILSSVSVVLALTMLTACGKKTDSSSTPEHKNSNPALVNFDEFEEQTKDVKIADNGPLLSLSNTTVKPGEIAEVTLSVQNAEAQWSMCGIHITYPEFLKPEMDDPSPEVRDVTFNIGDAVKKNSGALCKEWQSGLPDVLTQKKLGCLFFTCMFNGNEGGDGEMVKVYLKVPEDAQPGAVYQLGSYYMSTDLFCNMQNTLSFQKYAFANFEGGTITVE
ncbi:MAG: hypothetical protein MJ100_00035 [Ruminococcus sp.]|nr:hypothetical protein [Ruminococcus sp.]